jgi:hypothetical protein
VQQIVVGEVGVAAPIGPPPSGAQVPPVEVAPVTLAPFAPAPMFWHAVVPIGKLFAPALHTRSPQIVEVSVLQAAPVGGAHVQASHARESLKDAKACFFVGYAGGHATSSGRAMHSVFGFCGSDGLGTQTWSAAHEPATGPLTPQRR